MIWSITETVYLVIVVTTYLMSCPFNKVEESFNTQAVHDILTLFPSLPSHSIDGEISSRHNLPYDHIQNPGVVPRTFIGALVIGLPLKIIKRLMLGGWVSGYDEDVTNPDLEMHYALHLIARFILAGFIIFSLGCVSRALHKKFGLEFRLCFLLFISSQFHYMYYASRFLPNTYAAILANLVFAAWINRQYSLAIPFIAFCVVIFRFDTCLFFGCLLIDAVFIRKSLTLNRLLFIGIPSGLAALLLTFFVDSVMWGRITWPELESLYFNVWLNKSHQWGVQSFYWYIYSCIPRMLVAGTPFLFLAEHQVTRIFLIPTLAFIFIYSLLPHKELRFILFVSPFLSISVVSGLLNVKYYLTKFLKPTTAKGLFFGLLALVASINLYSAFIGLKISQINYPGGDAVLSMGLRPDFVEYSKESRVGFYVGDYAAQTGVNRFLQTDGVYYSKTPKLNESSFRNTYDNIYVVIETKQLTAFVVVNCQSNLDQRSFDTWMSSLSEVDCVIPNQPKMSCSLIDRIEVFNSFSFAKLFRSLLSVKSYRDFTRAIHTDRYISLRLALVIFHCTKLK